MRLTLRLRLALCAALLPVATPMVAQIRVSPTGVSTNAMAATTVFLTFGGLRNQRPVEGIWCGELLPAIAPDIGRRCDPQTIYGRLPLRSDLSSLGLDKLTDVMSIPASVTRRAYLAALRGPSATFFYVRRFASTIGGPDEYVVVTCRLTGGGANVPFSLTNVTVAFESRTPVQLVQTGETPPPLSATIVYNGSGQLRGRWEVVMPGETPPSPDELLTEATLPPEQRGQQQRYALLERFNVPALSGGRIVLPGPDPARLPHAADGSYLILLRIEATDDGAGDSNLDAAGASGGILHNGAVAGFPMPTLRYVVGSAESTIDGAGDESAATRAAVLLRPRAGARWPRDSAVTAEWTSVWGATYYRVEFETAAGRPLLSAIVKRGRTAYETPPMLGEQAAADEVRWRVTALDGLGAPLHRSPWRRFRFVTNGNTP